MNLIPYVFKIIYYQEINTNMSKDPAFLFYPGDWLGGTMLMSRLHKGAYMDVLMAQYNNGHMSEDQIKILLGKEDENLWETVLKSKFKQDSEGKFYNERLDKEIIKRRKFTESRKNNLNKSKPDMDKHMETHMDIHMENENENININRNRNKKGGAGGKKINVKKEKEIIYPFSSENFLIAWNAWKKYKKEEHRFNYKSQISEQGALTELDNLSGHIEDKAIEIIKQSIQKGWKGFFPLKVNNNGRTKTTGATNEQIASIIAGKFASDRPGSL